jgi:hypothetical protein
LAAEDPRVFVVAAGTMNVCGVKDGVTVPTILNVLSANVPVTLSVTRNVTLTPPATVAAPIVPVIAPVVGLRVRPEGKLAETTEYVTPLPPTSSVAANSVLFADEEVEKVARVAPAAGEVHEIPVSAIVAVLVTVLPKIPVSLTL